MYFTFCCVLDLPQVFLWNHVSKAAFKPNPTHCVTLSCVVCCAALFIDDQYTRLAAWALWHPKSWAQLQSELPQQNCRRHIKIEPETEVAFPHSSQYIIVPVCFTVFNHEVNCCQSFNVMHHWNCSFPIMASAGGHRVWKHSESSPNVSMRVSVWLVVKLPTQKLQWGDGLMPATHRTQSAISLTSTYVTSKAESGMSTLNAQVR